VKIFKLNTRANFYEKDLCLAIGNFDGVHKGHQILINKLLEVSNKNHFKPSILSFYPHPRNFFEKTKERLNIITSNEKKELIKKMGISFFIDYLFNEELSSMLASEFVEKILIKQLKIRSIIIGTDFRFGKNRKGDLNLLENISNKNNFTVYAIDPLIISNENKKISSSTIRSQIKNGMFEEVNFSLGRNWQMYGEIIRGDQKARSINFPTANVLPGNHILPMKGVYCVNAYIDKQKYYGISNFGERPTVDGKKLLLETHIFDFNRDIYGKELTVEFLTFIRPEQKFENFEELTIQIKKDILRARTYHKI